MNTLPLARNCCRKNSAIADRALRQCTRFKLLFWRIAVPSRVVSCTEVVLRFSNDWQNFPSSQSNNVCVNILQSAEFIYNNFLKLPG